MASFRAWQQWARWGSQLRETPPPISMTTSCVSPPDFTPVSRVVDAFRNLAQLETLHLQRLLIQSDQYLAPLSDPLRFHLWKNRWLDWQREREESYTDWFAWLLQEMGAAAAILKVFDLHDTEFGGQVRNAPPQVDREEPIRTRSGERKRLDLTIRFGDAGILLVEVKVRPIEEVGGSDNLEVYLDWLRSQKAAAKHAVLLVPESIEPPCDGWDVRGWGEVGLRLRAQAIALGNADPNNRLLAAMLLGFSGAVEQNVLGLDGTELASAAPRTARYLESFLEENRP